MPNNRKSIHRHIYGEKEQNLQKRQQLLQEVGEGCGGMLAVAYYTSFRHESAMISDSDIAPLEDVLQCSDLKDGLLLIISSPGGSGLAAERIINVCRQYSKGKFHALVPKQAKSAATMICLGAESIYMSQTSELGPIDPQIPQVVAEQLHYIPADIVTDTYKKLLRSAVSCKGRIEPYLQQLQAYDSRLIAVYEREQSLGKDIAIKALKQGMMKSRTESIISKQIQPFIKAGITGSHGRPILIPQAKKCGLEINEIDIEDDLWAKIMEYHLRADGVVNSDGCGKIIESHEYNFSAPIVKRSK